MSIVTIAAPRLLISLSLQYWFFLVIHRLSGNILEVAVRKSLAFEFSPWVKLGINLRDQVIAILVLLEATKGHLGAGNVLLGVLKVFKQGLVVPDNALVLVGIGEGVAGGGTGLAAEEAVQVGADLVATVLLDGVALSTTGLEEVGTLLSVTWRDDLAWDVFPAVKRFRGGETATK